MLGDRDVAACQLPAGEVIEHSIGPGVTTGNRSAPRHVPHDALGHQLGHGLDGAARGRLAPARENSSTTAAVSAPDGVMGVFATMVQILYHEVQKRNPRYA